MNKPVFNSKDNTLAYYTNEGSATLDAETGKVTSCCVGYKVFNYPTVVVRILRDSFSIRLVRHFFTEYAETASKNYPYRMPSTPKASMSDVYFTLERIRRMTPVQAAVLKTLVPMLQDNGISQYTRQILELANVQPARTPHKHYKRTPIITVRKPIILRRPIIVRIPIITHKEETL